MPLKKTTMPSRLGRLKQLLRTQLLEKILLLPKHISKILSGKLLPSLVLKLLPVTISMQPRKLETITPKKLLN